jgi:aconitate hydratase
VLIAAITSCTNTSNPAVMIAAGLLARKAVAKGLRVQPHIKTSLAPGSRVVTDYLDQAGLLAPLAELGFALAGYGCTTCIGNAGDLDPAFNRRSPSTSWSRRRALGQPQLRGAHPSQPARQLPGFAAAGGRLRHRRPGQHRPRQRALGTAAMGSRSICATSGRARTKSTPCCRLRSIRKPSVGVTPMSAPTRTCGKPFPLPAGEVYDWPPSTYIARPPFFELPSRRPATSAARALLLLGDSVTTDHISPAGSFGEATPAGSWLTHRASPAPISTPTAPAAAITR